jgi:RimJ/RimL family protein N-acetyltransferase
VRDHLRGERLRLTAMTEADVPTLARWYADGEFLRLLDSEPAHPRNEAQMAEYVRNHQTKPDCFYFAIRRNDDDTLVGFVEIDGVLWSQRVTYFSIAIGDPAERNRGYGSEALELMLGFAFHKLNLHRVALTVFSYNTQAIRAYEKAGFTLEGRHREFLERDGVRYDMLQYGLLRPEWEALRRERAAQSSGAESSGS